MKNITRLTEELAELGLYPQITADSVGSFDKNSSYACRLISSFIADYYEGLENIAKRIAKEIDGHFPSGQEWHRELLEQVSRELPGKRPAAFSEKTFEMIDELRRFRHIFRAKYGFSLNPKKVYENLSLVHDLHSSVCEDIKAFLDKMEVLSEFNN